jgi:hypothetical protein
MVFDAKRTDQQSHFPENRTAFSDKYKTRSRGRQWKIRRFFEPLEICDDLGFPLRTSGPSMGRINRLPG